MKHMALGLSHEPMRTTSAQKYLHSFGYLGRVLIRVALTFVLIAVSQSSGLATDRRLENGRPVIRNFLPNEYQAHDQNIVAVQDSRGLVYFADRALVLECAGDAWRR